VAQSRGPFAQPPTSGVCIGSKWKKVACGLRIGASNNPPKMGRLAVGTLCPTGDGPWAAVWGRVDGRAEDDETTLDVGAGAALTHLRDSNQEA
jgi:hypothetical protein